MSPEVAIGEILNDKAMCSQLHLWNNKTTHCLCILLAVMHVNSPATVTALESPAQIATEKGSKETRRESIGINVFISLYFTRRLN